ncbi:MAG: hypothetical protein KTR31_04870 [Myxococcales bacterium]|nr:hypothetical protein [Myxococcales bacterium]
MLDDLVEEAARALVWVVRQRTLEQLVQDGRMSEIDTMPGTYVTAAWGGRVRALVKVDGDVATFLSIKDLG